MAPGPIDRRHQRFLEQASWTLEPRRRLLGRLPGVAGTRILEVGAGTGVVAGEISDQRPTWRVFGLDLELSACRFGAHFAPHVAWQCGDAHALPFAEASFHSVLFHFVLLWLEDPALALAEAVRVTRPGGWVAALAEPDHAARIDFPDALARLGERQTEALGLQGADIRIGRRVRALFSHAGLEAVETGILGGVWDLAGSDRALSSEWRTLREDLELSIPPRDLDDLEAFDRHSWSRGERILFVPTFYAFGRVG